jgi:hypothetical protein
MCSAGLYQLSEGQVSCIGCTTGRYVKAQGADSDADCAECPSGKYQNEQAQSFCKGCTAGSKRNATDDAAEACSMCDAGMYSGAESSVCTLLVVAAR